MVHRISSVEEDVTNRLKEAGFLVRAGFMHGRWHMVATFGGETFAVSGMNAAGVANALMQACKVEIERRRLPIADAMHCLRA